VEESTDDASFPASALMQIGIICCGYCGFFADANEVSINGGSSSSNLIVERSITAI
jgi:hypothetical protein